MTSSNTQTAASVIEQVQIIASCITANRSNTLAMVECLKACQTKRPYREIEDELAANVMMSQSLQNPHVLIELLIEAGAIERMPISNSGEGLAEGLDAKSEDMPADYTLQTTEAGLTVIEEMNPLRSFNVATLTEPQEYMAVYADILDLCKTSHSTSEIESYLKDREEMTMFGQVFTSKFTSKLETVGALVYDSGWITTAAGLEIMEQLRRL